MCCIFLLYLNSKNFMKLLNYYGDVVGDYICLCAYMLLVNFDTCNGVELLVWACNEWCWCWLLKLCEHMYSIIRRIRLGVCPFDFWICLCCGDFAHMSWFGYYILWMYLWVDDMATWGVCYISAVMFYCWNLYTCQLRIIWRREWRLFLE